MTLMIMPVCADIRSDPCQTVYKHQHDEITFPHKHNVKVKCYGSYDDLIELIKNEKEEEVLIWMGELQNRKPYYSLIEFFKVVPVHIRLYYGDLT